MNRLTLMLIVASSALLLVACATTDGASTTTGEESRYVNVRVIDEPVALNRVDGDVHSNDILCKRMRVSGSHFYRTYCATRAEWEAERRRARQWLTQLRRSNAADKAQW